MFRFDHRVPAWIIKLSYLLSLCLLFQMQRKKLTPDNLRGEISVRSRPASWRLSDNF